MGSGTWSSSTFKDYATSKGYSVTTSGVITSNIGVQDAFKQRHLASELNPFNVVRECRDTEEHPNTVPVILALDVTGSMGRASVEVAKRLNTIMTELFDKVKDVEFMIMGIGDLAYDGAPVQASQFESDIRIAEQLDKIYFEGGGGGNAYESYTAAWYFGLYQTDLDCWKRGKKGIIITLGDEPLNPYLPIHDLNNSVGKNGQEVGDVETKSLYEKVKEKYNIYHIAVDDRETCYKRYGYDINQSWGKYLDSNHLRVATLDSLANEIVNIVMNDVESNSEDSFAVSGINKDENGCITW